MKSANDIKAVLFNEKEKDNDITRRFLQLKGPYFQSYKDDEELNYNIINLKKIYNSKEVIILKAFKGRFFQTCPGSRGVTCCNYRIVNTGFNCLFDCTYCFLNSYLNSFGILQFTNLEEMYREIDIFLKDIDPDYVYRIGSGEFTDSLMMDNVTRIGENLIAKFVPHGNVMFELKTKSDNIDHLLSIKEKGSTVLAWSLNTERNIERYEHESALLHERIEAAKKAGKAGFFLAFHFDPIIIYDKWEEDYCELIRRLFSNVGRDKVVWISLGCFRYSPGFKDVLREKFPDEELTLEEMFPGIDGKYRYLKNKRIEIYRTMKSCISKYTDKPFIYLCMEGVDVWHSVFNKYYDSSFALENDFGFYLRDTFLK
ncbi:MAG: DNA photolyase [Spirochaetes bacterium]|nr:DNA photolyase [Spirochaetota bacterium]